MLFLAGFKLLQMLIVVLNFGKIELELWMVQKWRFQGKLWVSEGYATTLGEQCRGPVPRNHYVQIREGHVAA